MKPNSVVSHALLQAAVEDAERLSTAELVVIWKRSSGNYRLLDVSVAAAFAVLAFLFFALSPWSFPVWSVPLPCLGAAALGYWSSASLGLRRLLIPAAVRRSNVLRGARKEFQDRSLERTQGRTALLLYFSAAEGTGCLVPDTGIQAAVPEARLRELERSFIQACRAPDRRRERKLAGFVRTLGVELGRDLPAPLDPALNPDELSNAPHLEGSDS